MQFYVFFVISLIAAAVHLLRDQQPRTGRRIAEIFLLWLLVIDIGSRRDLRLHRPHRLR